MIDQSLRNEALDRSRDTVFGLRMLASLANGVGTAVLAESPSRTILAANQAFHELIVETSGNRTLIEMHRQLVGHMGRYRMRSLDLRGSLERSVGEHGAIVRLMTPKDGLRAAYVRGARGRRMRPVLIAGNIVQAHLSARTDMQLPQATMELVHSRGPLLSEPLPAAAIEWACALTATVLPERQPYPRLYSALEALLE